MNCFILLVLLLIAVTGCATVPKPLAVGPFTEVIPSAAQNDNFVGQRVRWGGIIAKTGPDKNETCLEVVSYPLDSSARPLESDMTEGRFIACAPYFYDPEVYSKGREVTIIGNIQESTVRKVGEYEYRYPLVRAEVVYLWPKIPYVYYGYHYYGGYNGSYGYWGPRYGYYRDPYW
jgi:outer membrane lipoprotein